MYKQDDLGTTRQAILADVPYVVDLSKKENHCLGFIPKMAYTSAVTGIKAVSYTHLTLPRRG